MAIPINIEDLVNGHVVESTRIEFKEGFNPNAVLHTICAFANDIDNTGGGYLIIGVAQEGGVPVLPPKGVPQAEIDGILHRLVELCHHIEPYYAPVAEPVLYQGAHLIVIRVAGGYGRPYKVPKDLFSTPSVKQYFIRKFASSVVASPEEERELFYISSDIPFDDRPNLAASVEDLDLGLMREHLFRTGSALFARSGNMAKREIARDMHLIAGPPEDEHPLNVGLLMFSNDPERFFPYALIEVVLIPDPTGTDMVERTFTGPIQRQLSETLAYLKSSVIAEAVIKQPDLAEATRIVNYPYAAVEEILSNAVYHRSYQIREPITVRITGDAIEIISFPGFARSITDREIAEKSIRGRAYRNRRIGDFLKELHLTEGRNTGFPNAYAALAENGSPDLVITMDEDRSFLSVAIPIHPYFAAGRTVKEAAFEQRVLETLGADSMSLTELAHALGYKGITKKLSAEASRLESIGTLRRVPSPDGRGTLLQVAR
mgnify:CR=1 FL=1